MTTAPFVVGIDLSATNLQFGVVNAENAVVGRARARTEADLGPDHVISNVCRGVEQACKAAGMRLDDIAAVGVAAAGAIDMPRGVVLQAPNLKWHDLPLRDMLAERLGRPVALDNDVNGAVWGEYQLGAGRGHEDLLGVWVGTGVGGGLVLGGRLHHGNFFTAGEIGHTVMDPAGGPGQRTVEDLCSRTAMKRVLGAEVTTQQIATAYTEGEPATCDVVNRSADFLGIAIANWVTSLSLGAVVIGGGMTEALGAPYFARIRASFDRDVFPDELRACELVMTALCADAGLLGAAMLAREK
jgi:glucokinase